MNKAEYAARIISQPWNLHRMRARTILGNLVNALLRSERPDEDLFGDPLPKMQIVGDLALIPLSGVVSINVPDWLKQLGLNLTDAKDIEEELGVALADANVRMIVLDVDSPGGLSLAGDLLFDVVEAANRKKPCFAWCGDGCDMASTAYEAVAPCTALLSGYYADGVGCIGSYLAMLDDTEFWLQMGMKWEVFRSGELKGIGEDALSGPQRDYLQGSVDQAGATFRRNVSKYRQLIAPEDMQGQWFDGKTAAQRGFVAGNASDLNAAIAKFRKF
ncbi:hypothetical protein BH20VER3_BH20VER3_00520 [soil metagenome]